MPVCPKCNTVYDDEMKFCRVDGSPLFPLSSETHLPIGVVVNESLRVVERLRTDRFGVVYRVEDAIDAGQSFALRLFRRGLVHSRAFAALGRLAERLRDDLQDPDILADYIPVQLEDGRYALLATDYPGTMLDALIVNEAPLKPRLVVAALLRVADVLANAHESGLVHGNVTPENVIVVDRTDRGLTIKLSDFGVASTIRQHNARALSSPPELVRLQNYDNYYAPELVTGRGIEADVRTDVFSLGALCYQMLSGWIPFTEAAIEGDAAVYLTHDPRPLTVLNGELGIPRALEQTMLKALELDPSARHGSIAELIDELQEIEIDLSMHPPPDARRSSPSSARHSGAISPDGVRRTTDPLAPIAPRAVEVDGATDPTETDADEDADGSRPFGA